MKTTPYKAAIGAVIFTVLAFALSPAIAQDAATRKDGLDKFLNMDAKDVETKLTCCSTRNLSTSGCDCDCSL